MACKTVKAAIKISEKQKLDTFIGVTFQLIDIKFDIDICIDRVALHAKKNEKIEQANLSTPIVKILFKHWLLAVYLFYNFFVKVCKIHLLYYYRVYDMFK